MKKYVVLILVLFITTNLALPETISVSDLEKPHQIVVKENELFIFEEADYSLHVYTISPFALKTKFGKKGDGPSDFKYLPFVHIRPDALVCTDFTKSIWFLKKGEIIKIKNYSDFENFNLQAEMLLFPVKKNYVQITADHEARKRHVFLLDSKFHTIKELYEGSFIWRTDAPIHYRTDTFVSKDKIFISDTQRGFYINIFSDTGKLIRTLDISREVEEIPGKPLLHQFNVSDDKIYAATYKKMGNKTEMIILDLKGCILKRFFLPLHSILPKRGVLRYDPFFVDQNRLYELIKNESSGIWELVITDLENL